MSRWARKVVAWCAVAWFASVGAQEAAYQVRLSTVPISANMQAATTGHGSATANLDGRQLSIRGSFEGLQGAATIARLHMGAIMGVRGEVIHELEVEQAPSGSLSGTIQLSRAEVQALSDGRLYVQIHSESAPEGNLWGWLLQ